MLPTFLIFFREILEIAIILSVVLAATRGIAGRNRWVWIGIGGGLLGSALVALFADNISESMEGMGQEMFNAAVLLAASVMIAWTVIWMQTHAREMVKKIKDTGKSITDGETPLYTVAIIVSLAMWREGAEIVLFMYGILSSTEESLLAITMGGIGGTIAAGALGFAIYFGLIKISTKYVFKVTGWMLILLACGMSAHAAGYLTAADAVPVLVPELWDTSAILSESSMLGKILHAMLGYTERPSGIQGVFYVATLLVILAMQKLLHCKPHTTHAAANA